MNRNEHLKGLGTLFQQGFQLSLETFFFFLFCPSIIFPPGLKSSSSFRVVVWESKVFDVLSDCKDKAAHLTHRAAASREKKNKFLILFFF